MPPTERSHEPVDPAGLVDVVRHLRTGRRPSVDALRLIAEGTLPAYDLPGRRGWWVQPDQLEACLSQHGPRLRAETAHRLARLAS